MEGKCWKLENVGTKMEGAIGTSRKLHMTDRNGKYPVETRRSLDYFSDENKEEARCDRYSKQG